MPDTCPFCQIADGERPAHVLSRSERAVAFLDENPATDGHALVAPTAHRQELFALDEATGAAVIRTLRIVADALDEFLDAVGFSVFYTTGSLVGNVEHAHVHLVPRYPDDGVDLSLARGELDDAEGADLVAELREAIDAGAGASTAAELGDSP